MQGGSAMVGERVTGTDIAPRKIATVGHDGAIARRPSTLPGLRFQRFGHQPFAGDAAC